MVVAVIAAAIAALPADQRRVLIMRDVQGLPGDMVARTLGLSTAAMKSRLHRARATVRTQLGMPDRVLRLIPAAGPVALLLLPAGVVALRGCPTCWLIGLAQTVSRGRIERQCAQGQCRARW